MILLENITKMLSCVSVLNSGNLRRAQVQEIYESRLQFTPNFSPMLILLQMFCKLKWKLHFFFARKHKYCISLWCLPGRMTDVLYNPIISHKAKTETLILNVSRQEDRVEFKENYLEQH